MSFTRPTLSALIDRARADIDARLPGADSRLRRSVLDVLARVHAQAVNGLYGAINYYAGFFPDPENRDAIERWASIKGLSRKPAIGASGPATVTGTNGTAIVAGTVLVRADGVRYATSAEALIAGGSAELAVVAQQGGRITDMAAGQQLTFVSPIAGVSAVAVVAAGGLVGGLAEESDAELSSRVYGALRNPPAGGKAADYIGWAREVPGVTRAWVEENWDGLGTLRLLFVMDGRADIIPLSADIDAVAAKIEAERPVCVEVTVGGPVADPLDFTLTVTPDTPDTRAAVEASLRDLIAREAQPGGTLLISRLREAVSVAAGETDHVMTAPSANVTAASGEIAVMGAITWS
ncbi:baseplate J/gp47 family protein [Sphingomonas sp. CJ99]